MNEGSFDQREAIFAPTPATIAFTVAVPPRARLRVAPALLAPMPTTTVFDVTLWTQRGPSTRCRRPAWRAGPEALDDVDADLARWGGQTVTLNLRTSSEKPAPYEKHWTPPTDEGRRRSPRSPAVPGDVAGPVGRPDHRCPASRRASPTTCSGSSSTPSGRTSPHRCTTRRRTPRSSPRPDPPARGPPAGRPRPHARHRSPRRPRRALPPCVVGGRLDAPRARWRCSRGERSSELGIDTKEWILPPEQVSRYYGAEPPLLPLVLRSSGVETAAFVNNFFMAGYVTVGPRHGVRARHRPPLPRARHGEITKDALGWLDGARRQRFFLFVNYNSPHEPYEPPGEMLARIPRPPQGPRDQPGARVHGRGREGRRGHRHAARQARRPRPRRSRPSSS